MKGTSSENAKKNNPTFQLKEVMNGAYDPNDAIALLKKGASPDTVNDKGCTLNDLTLAYYLKDEAPMDYKDINLGEKIYKRYPVTIHLGQMSGQNVVIKKMVYNGEYDQTKTRELVNLRDFCSEVHFMMRLKNAPNIVQIMEYNIEKMSHHIIMEYAVNGSLDGFMKKYPNSAHNWKFRYEILRGMTNGIFQIHLSNIVHCDLKCANVFLDKDMIPKIADFGSAINMFTKSTRERTTLPYRAPEIFETYAYSAKSDIFSLSIIIWELAAWTIFWSTIHHMMHNDNDMYAYFEEGKRPEIPENCPPKFSALMKRGWSTNPKDRPLALEILVELDGEMEEISENLQKFVSLG